MASTTSIDHLINSQITNFQQHSSAPIIDLRSKSEFIAGHWQQACHFPLETIISRMSELPKRNQPLRLVGTSQQIEQAEKLLSDKGYQIQASIVWSEPLESQLLSFEVIEKGASSPRLWSPAPIVESFQQAVVGQNEIGRALDIGCGAGRDSVYLASHGWQVDAVDYLEDALNKVNKLAAANQVELSCHLIDLEKEPQKLIQLCQNYQLILVSRYLHRPLLPVIRELIAPGGYIVYQTFMQGCEAFGSPKNPRFLLQAGELAKVFSEFRLIQDEVEYLDDGRPTNAFIAQKVV